MNELLGGLLTIGMLFVVFRVMLGPLLPAPRGHAAGAAHYGTGCLTQLATMFTVSVILPMVWWLVSFVGRVYYRAFFVSTEFVSGVHDWATYRTSLLKYLGAVSAFLGFNGVLVHGLLLAVLFIETANALGAHRSGFWVGGIEGYLATLLPSILFLGFARFFLRRMP